MNLTQANQLKPETNGEKFEQILQGAMQEFLARGYAGTSMEKSRGCCWGIETNSL
jgi:TetR/AcrR family transcriptional regulator, regulator of autoinduction and epiphytic fitness